jgi:hypothetical protein
VYVLVATLLKGAKFIMEWWLSGARYSNLNRVGKFITAAASPLRLFVV